MRVSWKACNIKNFIYLLLLFLGKWKACKIVLYCRGLSVIEVDGPFHVGNFFDVYNWRFDWVCMQQSVVYSPFPVARHVLCLVSPNPWLSWSQQIAKIKVRFKTKQTDNYQFVYGHFDYFR